MSIEITFSRSKEQLKYNGKTIWAWNKVRSLENGLRTKSEVVYTEPLSGDKKPYSPQLFPLGRFQIQKPVSHTDVYLAPFFIPTTAGQFVDTYSLNANGYYSEKVAKQFDGGYGLHYSVSDTTLGCIRIANLDDLLGLVKYIISNIQKEDIFLTVSE